MAVTKKLAKTKCPVCNKTVYEECPACVEAGLLVGHGCLGADEAGCCDEDDVPCINDVEWELL